jgi:hypothetical protein
MLTARALRPDGSELNLMVWKRELCGDLEHRL